MSKTILLFLTILISFSSYASFRSTVPVSPAPDSKSLKVVKATDALEIVRIWARPVTVIQGTIVNTAVYFIIKNHTNQTFKLMNASSDIANKVELHQTFTDQGVSKMVKVDTIEIPGKHNDSMPYNDIEFKPGGIHIMLNDVKKTLNEGDEFDLILYFNDNSARTITVTVSRDGIKG